MKYDYSKIYNNKVLSYWHTRYPENISWNFYELMMGKLRFDERKTAFGSRLEFPLIPHEGLKSSPFSFYADVRNKLIYVPVSSVKFIDDLAIASAWLLENDYSQETLIDYISLLKYGYNRFPAGRITEPLKALCIPENALDNKRVDDLSLKITKSIIVWVLGHELGHIVYQHPAYENITFKQSQECEKQADAFATDMFRRIGTGPLGAILLFHLFTSFFMHRGDFGSHQDWEEYLKTSTHPVSNERLKIIANELIRTPGEFVGAEPNPARAAQVVLNVGRDAFKIAELIDSEKMQEFMRARALAVDINSIFPRKSGELPITEQLYKKGIFSEQPFSGIYSGIHTRNLVDGGIEKLNATVVFYRNGNKVTGKFTFGVGVGEFSGIVQKNTLYYQWKWGDAKGMGKLFADTTSDFSGEWGHDDQDTGGGLWNGTKSK
jgi:hypothetical protein